MKRRPKLLSLTLCVSVGLHGCLLCMRSLERPGNRGTMKTQAGVKPFSLVNLALPEPPEPDKPPPETPSRPPPPPPPEPPGLEPAETLVALETPVPNEAREPAPAEDPRQSDLPEDPEDAAAARAYLQNHYAYIQRHIRSKLVYPAEARGAGIQGVAELSFVIHPDGQVSNVRITASSGSETLDASAVEAIYSAAPFRPPPRKARLVIPVAFRLR